MKANIEIPDSNIQEIVKLLNRLLANEYVLFTKTWAAHWNVQGSNFIGMHEFLKEQYQSLELVVDDTAERIRSLGHYAMGTLKDFLSTTDMVEDSGNFASQKQILQMLTNDHETIIRIIRNEIAPIVEKNKDLGTADFITSVMEQHEKMAWMLRAHLSEN